MLPELPLYDAFKRIQKRPGRLMTVLFIVLFVLILTSSFIWFETSNKYIPFTEKFFKNFGRTFSYAMMVIQFFVLSLLGTGAVELRIRMDTTNDIISFHKLTPLSSHNLIWGYILGPTFELYIVWLIFFIFGFLGIFLREIPFHKYLFSSFLIFISSIFFHICAVMDGLNKSLTSGRRTIGLPGLIIWGGLIFYKSDIGFLTPIPSLLYILAKNIKTSHYSFLSNIHTPSFNVPFFYFYLPPFVYSFILWILFGIIFYFSCKRRIILSKEEEIFSKKEIVFLLSIICFLIIGRIIGILNLNPDYFLQDEHSETIAEFYIILSRILIFFSSLILLSMSIPRRLEFIHQFVRNNKGEKIFWWENASSLMTNLLILTISITSILIIDIYISLTRLMNMQDYWLKSILRILIFVSTMFFFNFIIEGCRLRFEKKADNISGLIIIFWFLLIPIVYIIYALNVEKPKLFLMGLSPLPFLIGDIKIKGPSLLCLSITNIILLFTFLFWKKSKYNFEKKYG